MLHLQETRFSPATQRKRDKEYERKSESAREKERGRWASEKGSGEINRNFITSGPRRVISLAVWAPVSNDLAAKNNGQPNLRPDEALLESKEMAVSSFHSTQTREDAGREMIVSHWNVLSVRR